MNNRWKIVEYYIYTRTKQEDFVLKQVEVLIDAPEKAKKELGWEAEYGIEDMCADSWRWQKNNPNGYED